VRRTSSTQVVIEHFARADQPIGAVIILEFETDSSSQELPENDRRAILEAPVFGQKFTDHMITLHWDETRGWHDGRLQNYGNLSLPPSASVFHYGQEIFEGLKAYRQADGSIALFRWSSNAARFNNSARRLAMPELPKDFFLQAIEALVRRDREWVPFGEGNSLYLRPFMIATQPTLGFTLPSRRFMFCLIASPAPAYFYDQSNPSGLRVWVSEDYSRAAPGGTGSAKAGGNYAAAFLAQRLAAHNDCDQVLWLDALERKWIEELGGMNVFFVRETGYGLALSTPKLSGTLLPGITREALLHLAPSLGLVPDQSRLSIQQFRELCETGEIVEAFACGTAAVIAPIGKVRGDFGEWTVADGNPGPNTLRLRSELLGRQHGRIEDNYGWMHTICAP
jgi:branched-chain amino acid aminotransferase